MQLSESEGRVRQVASEWRLRFDEKAKEIETAAESHAQEIAKIQEKNIRDFEELSERLKSFRQKSASDLEARDRLILQLQASLGDTTGISPSAQSMFGEPASDGDGQQMLLYAKMKAKREEESLKLRSEVSLCL